MNARGMRDTELVTWDPKQKDVIVRYVESLMDILTIDEQGRVKTTERFQLDILSRILAENVTLEGISRPAVKRALIRRTAFDRLKKYKQQDVYMFRRALAEVRRHLSRPAAEYWVLLPLHLAPRELRRYRSLSVLGRKLLFRDWDYVGRHFDLERLFRELDMLLPRQGVTVLDIYTNFSPVLACCEGKDVREAFNRAIRAFDLLRWLINLTHQFGRVTSQWGGYPRPLGMVLPSPIYGVFSGDRVYEDFFYTTPKYDKYARNTLRGDELAQVRRLARRLGEPESDKETAATLIEALEKYGEALDAFEWRLAFLTLWQILELIALQSPANLNMKTVKSRIGNLLGNKPLEKDLLNALYATRNLLVHRGAFPDEEGLKEVNLLKWVVEDAINELFRLLRTCPTRASLQRYYELVPQNDTELRDRQRLISSIRRRREGDSAN